MRTTILLLMLTVMMAGCTNEPPANKASTQPATEAITAPALSQEQVVAEIKKCGGIVQRDGDTPDGSVVGVMFSFEVDPKISGVAAGLPKGPDQGAGIYSRGWETKRDLAASLKGPNQGSALFVADVTDAGLEHLKGLPQIQTLGLEGTNITDAGLEHVKALDHLKTLVLTGTKVTDQGVKRLHEALPRCKIIR